MIKVMMKKPKKENNDDKAIKIIKKVVLVLLGLFLVVFTVAIIYATVSFYRLGNLAYDGEMKEFPDTVIDYPDDEEQSIEGLPSFVPPNSSPTPTVESTPEPTLEPVDIVNILIIGCDSKKMHQFGNARSDVCMILTIDEENNEVKLSSYMRDILVFYDHLTAKDGSAGDYQKLNASLQYFDHPDGVVKTMEETFDVKIDYYMLTDYWGVEKLINILHGVRIYLTDRETRALNDVVARYNRTYGHTITDNYVEHGAGSQTLNGRQAVSFMRIRKIDSDIGRIGRQQKVLTKIKGKISNMDLLDVTAIIASLPDMITTDMSQLEIVKYTKILYSMKDNEFECVRIPFDDTWRYVNYHGLSAIEIDFQKNIAMIKEFMGVE